VVGPDVGCTHQHSNTGQQAYDSELLAPPPCTTLRAR
jgi:hypothetical protein